MTKNEDLQLVATPPKATLTQSCSSLSDSVMLWAAGMDSKHASRLFTHPRHLPAPPCSSLQLPAAPCSSLQFGLHHHCIKRHEIGGIARG